MKYNAGALLVEWFIEKDCEEIYGCEDCGVQRYCHRAVDIVVEGNKYVKRS